MPTRQQAFWSSKDNTENYAKYPVRSAYLVDLVRRYLDPGSTILEPGCNMGRNVAALREAGYTVHGIDVSPYAPRWGNGIQTIAAEDYLPTAPNYDAIITMAFLEHVPGESEFIFEHIARLANRLIVTIEDEATSITQQGMPYHIPRDYGRIFTALGWKEVFIGKNPADLGEEFVARAFVRDLNELAEGS